MQTLSFHWCRFLSYPCTVCMSRNVRKFSLPCVTSVTWTNLSLYLIITWRINRQHDDLTVPVNARSSILCCVYRIVIDTDHLTNIVQDYSIGIGVNILLHQTDITSCAHKWGQYTPALISTHPIKKYPTNSPILSHCGSFGKFLATRGPKMRARTRIQ